MVDKEPPELEGDDEGEGIDLRQVSERVGFAMRAPGRRRALATCMFALTAGLGVAVAATMPRGYAAETKILAQRNLLTPALSNPSRQVPREADNPTRNVADMILRHDNLVSLVKDVDLVRRYHASRSPLIRLKDHVLGEKQTDDERLRGMVSTLEKKLLVVTDDSTVTVSIEWGDPLLAYDLINRIEKNFLEARYDDEVAMISDAVAVLQDHAKEQLDQLDTALDQYQRVLAELGPRSDRAAPTPAVVYGGLRSGGGAPVDPQLTAALEEKRHQIRSLEGARQRELETLQQQLMQAQLGLTSHHPTVIALQQKVDSLSQPLPELAQLKREERALMAQIAPPAPVRETPRPSGGNEDSRIASNVPMAVPAAPEVPGTPHWDDNGRARLARSRLEGAIHNYQDIQARIDSANIELEIARTAFKYRYTVVKPPEIPKHPKKPIAILVGIASILFGILVAVGASVLADRRKGRILEEWQVRRKLKVDILGELEMPGEP
jgi:uncharacterized protein involved in exopolysaccharide biosynthesis